MTNILLVTKGTGGDLSPFLSLGRKLQDRGHDVTLFTHCQYAEMAEQAGLNFVALDTPDEFEGFIEDGHLLNAAQDIPVFFQRHILSHVRSDYAKIEERCVSEQTVLIARHMSDIAARFAAEKLGVPLVCVFTAPIQAAAISLLGDLCKSNLGASINQSRKELGLPPVRDWHTWLQQPELSIGLWPDWFSQPEVNWPTGLLTTGFLWYDDTSVQDVPANLQQFLDSHKHPVLITGGTGMFVGDRFFSASVGACQLLGLPGVIITRHRELIPERLPENIAWFETWFDRFPSLADFMSRFGVIIHHGGMGTLGQALAAGIPQLILAVGGDRPDNAARLQRLGIAEFLRPPQWQADVVAETLHRLTHSPRVREQCKEIAGWLRDTDPTAAACDVIEGLLTEVRKYVTVSIVSNIDMFKVEKTPLGERSDRLDDLVDLSPEKRALIAQRLGKNRGE